MARGDTYTIMFAAVVCIACSMLLSVTSASLKERQDRMIELDRQRNVLKALGLPLENEDGTKLANSEVERVFREQIVEMTIDAATGRPVDAPATKEEIEAKAKLPLYLLMQDEEVSRYAMPVSGKGLWSTIHGYLALDRDLETVVGVTFYRHGETPGLGGEISKDWFQERFKGLSIRKDGRLAPIAVVKGLMQGNPHAVQGISGATLTGNGITHFLKRDLELYEKYFETVRGR